jgi:hypothetical protein
MLLCQVLQEGVTAEQHLLLPLAVVMSQQLDYVLYSMSSKHIKEVAELHDRVNETCLQVGRVDQPLLAPLHQGSGPSEAELGLMLPPTEPPVH